MKKEKHSVCRQAASFYCDLITKEQPVPADIRRHIENCPHCRGEMQRLQDELSAPADPSWPAGMDLLRLQLPLFDRWVNCRQILPFLPFLSIADPAPSVPTPASAHLAHCPVCRRDLETLRRLSLTPSQTILAGRFLADDPAAETQIESPCRQTLDAIRRRPSSAILTRIRRDQTTGRFHVSVAAEQTHSQSASAVRPPVRWLRRGLVAAVLLVAALVFWRIPAARGLDLDEVYQAIGNALNVAIASYEPPQDADNVFITSYAQEGLEPIQQIWISNTLEIQLYIEKDQAVLWDLQRQQKIIRTAAGRQILPISDPVRKLETPWGLLPSRNPDQLPRGYRWRSVSLPGLENDPTARIYDLTWTDTASGIIKVQRRWRGFLNGQSKLPYRIEWWDKLPGQEFKMMSVTLITYPPEDQVLAQIAAEGFDYRPADHK